MEHIWNYGGNEYTFDISESENMTRMCGGLNALRDEIRVLDDTDAGDTLREQCRMIRRFFDTVLGDGMGETICGTVYSADAHTTAYMEFILFVNAQVTAFREKVAAVEEKYMSRAAEMEAYGA